MNGLTLDAGALIAIERGQRLVLEMLDISRARGTGLSVPAGALAQVWRGRSTQAPLAQFLRRYRPEIVPLDARQARAAGLLCAEAGTSDVVDASVVVCARARGHVVLTSDPGDIAKLAPGLPIRAV